MFKFSWVIKMNKNYMLFFCSALSVGLLHASNDKDGNRKPVMRKIGGYEVPLRVEGDQVYTTSTSQHSLSAQSQATLSDVYMGPGAILSLGDVVQVHVHGASSSFPDTETVMFNEDFSGGMQIDARGMDIGYRRSREEAPALQQAVRGRRHIVMSNMHIPAGTSISMGGYNGEGENISLTDSQVRGDVNIKSVQKSVLTRCVFAKNLNCIAPGCDLIGTQVAGACNLRRCLRLFLSEGSSVAGDITFADIAGKVVKRAGCQIAGKVHNGTVEEVE